MSADGSFPLGEQEIELDGNGETVFAAQAPDVHEIRPVASLEQGPHGGDTDLNLMDSAKSQDEQAREYNEPVTEQRRSRKFYALVALTVLLSLILAGILMRIVMSRRHGSDDDQEFDGFSRQEEAAYCTRNGCLNSNCLRIDACHTDPDEAYCADAGCVNFDCPQTGACAVDGRPFRESLTSNPLLAEATIFCRDCPWSVSKGRYSQTLDFDVVSTWSERAVGEHASIASFAAFTIALLTHEAPPDLVADAIQAASDELRHAQLAFGRASSANGGVGLGPTALPDSHLHFANDLTTLAKAVAQEGCIDETLSALELAQESEHENEDKNLLWEIARDEARHSLLAWRTLHWVCQQDATACQATMESTLRPDRIASAVELRLGRRPQRSSNTLDDAWQRIAAHLIPSVRDRPVECPTYVPGASAVDTLVMDIIRGFCRPVMAA